MYLDAAKSQALSNLMRLLAGDYSEREVRRSVGTALLHMFEKLGARSRGQVIGRLLRPHGSRRAVTSAAAASRESVL